MATSADIEAFARTICSERLGLLLHHPEEGMASLLCFSNVQRRIARDGGRARYGWIFQLKRLQDAPHLEYLVAIHHAVWNGPDEKLVDPTPFPDGLENHPITNDGSPLFLWDPQAEPLQINGSPITFPMKYHPIGDDQVLLDHVRTLRRAEYRRMNEIRAVAARARGGSIIDTHGNTLPLER